MEMGKLLDCFTTMMLGLFFSLLLGAICYDVLKEMLETLNIFSENEIVWLIRGFFITLLLWGFLYLKKEYEKCKENQIK